MKKIAFITAISLLLCIFASCFTVSASDPLNDPNICIEYGDGYKWSSEEEFARLNIDEPPYIHYNELEELGTLQKIGIPNEILDGKPESYSYVIKDESGTDIYISIRNILNDAQDVNTTTVEVDLSDLRTNTSGGEGYYVHDGLTYIYLPNGKLEGVSINEDGFIVMITAGCYNKTLRAHPMHEYYIKCDPTDDVWHKGWLGNYPENSDTLIGRILDLDNNPKAAKELVKLFKSEKGCGSAISMTASATAALAVACGAVIVRKRKDL